MDRTSTDDHSLDALSDEHYDSDDPDCEESRGLGDAGLAAAWSIAGSGPHAIEELAESLSSPYFGVRVAVERRQLMTLRSSRALRAIRVRRRPVGRARRRRRVGGVRRARARSPGRRDPGSESELADTSARAS
jgi:hypothetical protein